MSRYVTLFAFFFVFASFVSAKGLAVALSEDNTCLENGDDPKAYPNPFKGKITINHGNCDKIEICTLLGEVVRTVNVAANDKSTQLDLSELKKGVYFYVIKENNAIVETRRIVKSE
ncbi:MAG: T9SS type A sorting domain-containing protein [Bacteroidota bacterium]